MKKLGAIAAAFAAACLVVTTPVEAAQRGDAEKLRRLDIMLMVTALRCRTTPDDFRGEFQRFEASHLDELNGAAAELRDGLVSAYGLSGANRALDRMSTTIANQYGQGHPWLGCAELKQSARVLAEVHGHDALVEAADQLLAPSGGPVLALARP